MAKFPAPFGSDFPNLERALVENVPVLCTLLVGFVGLLFVTVATLPDIDKTFHEVSYRPLVIFPPVLFSIGGRAFALWISGLDCLFFYFAVLSIIYARMSDYRNLISETALAAQRCAEPLLAAEQARLDRRREKFVTLCMLAFNGGICSLPLALLPATHQRWHQSIVINGAIALLIFSLVSNRQRLSTLFRWPLW